MKLAVAPLAFMLGLGLAVPAVAQEETKKEEPAAAEPAKEEVKPAAEAAPAAPAAAAPAKELSACAKSFVPLSDTYKAAYDDMQKWIAQIDTQTSAAADKVAKLQTAIEQNEAALTQAKLANDSSKTKDLQKQNKKLYDDFNAAKKDLAGACSKFAKDAADKVKGYADASSKALDALKSSMK
jgi:hypothetical protein